MAASGATRKRGASSRSNAAAAAGSDGRERKTANAGFSMDVRFPESYRSRPPPVLDESMPQRVAELAEAPALLPDKLQRKLGLRTVTDLEEPLQQAAARGGRDAARHLRHAARKGAQARAAEAQRPKPPPLGSGVMDEKLARQVFTTFDLDSNEVIDARELKHLFWQLGEEVKDSEIDAMIRLCDTRGEGTVSFEDFLVVFTNPAEELRSVNVAALREALYNEKHESSDDEDNSDESSSSSSDAASKG